MQMIGEVLDKRVVDRNGRAMGRVDGIEATLVEDEPPEITAIVIGPAALADRLGPRVAVWWRRFAGRLAAALVTPVRVRFAAISVTDGMVRTEAAIGETGAGRVEQWARGVIQHIPRSGR